MTYRDHIEIGWGQGKGGVTWTTSLNTFAQRLETHAADITPEVAGILRELFEEAGRLLKEART